MQKQIVHKEINYFPANMNLNIAIKLLGRKEHIGIENLQTISQDCFTVPGAKFHTKTKL